MHDITFPPIESENPSQQTIDFEVIFSGCTMKCSITYKALYDYFDAENSDPLFAFMSGRAAIESLITKRINDNEYKLGNEITIQSSDLLDISNRFQ